MTPLQIELSRWIDKLSQQHNYIFETKLVPDVHDPVLPLNINKLNEAAGRVVLREDGENLIAPHPDPSTDYELLIQYRGHVCVDRLAANELLINRLREWLTYATETKGRQKLAENIPQGEEEYSPPKSIKELARIFEMSESTLGRWLRTGQIQGKKLGNRWQVLMSEMPIKDEKPSK